MVVGSEECEEGWVCLDSGEGVVCVLIVEREVKSEVMVGVVGWL